MRALLLVNPAASTTDRAAADAVTRRLARALDLRVMHTTHAGHATAVAAAAAAAGYDLVVTLGGDGTVNEVLQSLAGTGVRLAVLPGGSTNVLARTLGTPRDLTAAVDTLLARVAAGRERTITLGTANGRWFAFAAGLGYDAEVVRAVEAQAPPRRVLRQRTFVWQGLLRLGSGVTARDPSIAVRAGDGLLTASASSVVCCNSDPYTYLGARPARLCPQADLALGLDLFTIDDLSLPALLQVMSVSLTSDRVSDLPAVSLWHDRCGYDAHANVALPLQVDGDYLGETSVLRLRAHREALTIIA